MRIAFLSFVLIALVACRTEKQHSLDEFGSMDSLLAQTPSEAPEWMKDVVWYQIFPERFWNGDQSNDPTPTDIAGAYPGFVPADWQITPWTQDWYAPDPWFTAAGQKKDWNGNEMDHFGQKAQLRRYGGDLQGVLDRLNYLDGLGITAIYFNPLNDAPSLHKYDPRYWHHIDRNFGPDPKGDAVLMANEDHSNPDQWVWTEADKLWLKVIEACHDRGIKVVMDYSWNHTGYDFWALNDIRKKGEQSDYTDWYYIDRYDDPDTKIDELQYQSWIGVRSLPEMRETERQHFDRLQAYEGDLFSESLKYHIFSVTKRWLDPNGDGDPSDGIDGFRLDVAAELPLGFWREYRAIAKGINPQAALIGEIWWEKWPDDLLDPSPWLQGDVFDAVMNYRWYREARNYFAFAPDTTSPRSFVANVDSIYVNVDGPKRYALMNMSASHDAPRLATSFYNRGQYKVNTNPSADPFYKINKPDSATYGQMKLFLGHQFTFVGAPQIWAGDEMGMWGGDDPNCRKPLIWPDLQFDPETTHPNNLMRPTDSVSFDHQLFTYYQKLVTMRQKFEVFRYGGLEFVPPTEDLNVLAYKRFTGKEYAYVFFNLTDQLLRIPVPEERRGTWVVASPGGQMYVEENEVGAIMEPMSWSALVRIKNDAVELAPAQ